MTVNHRIYQRRDTTTNWNGVVLGSGEFGYDTTLNQIKMGNNSTAFQSLPYFLKSDTTTFNKVTITAPATGSTLTVANLKSLTVNNTLTFNGIDGKALTLNNTLTFSGTDASSVAFGTGGTVAYLEGTQTFVNAKTFTNPNSGQPSVIFKYTGSGPTNLTTWVDQSNAILAAVTYQGLASFNSLDIAATTYLRSTTYATYVDLNTLTLSLSPKMASAYLTIPASATATSGTNSNYAGIEIVTTANNSATARYAMIFSSSSYGIGGAITVSANGGNPVTGFSNLSDYRLKNNVKKFTTGSSQILALNPVEFNWRDSKELSYGFLAHELQSVVPEAVTGDKDAVNENGDPNYQMVDQSKIIPYLVSALQDALKRIEILEAK
jgi:hypothetical protein